MYLIFLAEYLPTVSGITCVGGECVCGGLSVCSFLTRATTVVQRLSHVQLFVTPGTVAGQAPLFLGFPGKNTGVGC